MGTESDGDGGLMELKVEVPQGEGDFPGGEGEGSLPEGEGDGDLGEDDSPDLSELDGEEDLAGDGDFREECDRNFSSEDICLDRIGLSILFLRRPLSFILSAIEISSSISVSSATTFSFFLVFFLFLPMLLLLFRSNCSSIMSSSSTIVSLVVQDLFLLIFSGRGGNSQCVSGSKL